MKRLNPFYDLKNLFVSITLVSVVCGLLVGCDNQQTIDKNNAKAVQSPEAIARMADGRILYCIYIERNNTDYDHVYFFSTNDVSTVSSNFRIGKIYQSVALACTPAGLEPIEK